MHSSSLQNQFKILHKTPKKIAGNDFFQSKENLSFYEKMISDFTFYVIQKGIDTSLIDQIKSIFCERCIRFVTFSFTSYEKNEFFIICFEDYCFIIELNDETANIYLKALLQGFIDTKYNFISPNLNDYDRFKSLNNINEKNLYFPSQKEKENIETEAKQIIKSIEKDIFEIPIFNMTKETISIYMIRRFFYKTKYFTDFKFLERSKTIELKEFQSSEFISLRNISENISLVFHKETNHLAVFKFLRNIMNMNDFKKEKKLYEKVNELHNFVKCYGYIKNGNNEILILVLEFMTGGTVQDYIVQKKKIDKYKMSFQILEGLNLLHSNDIIHRDLHPENIFLNHDNDVFIGDFDCSKYFIGTSKSLTKDVGSLIYSSPEIINSQKYSKSTDIYSFGLVLYFIFTEIKPYNLLSYLEIIGLKNDISFNQFKDRITDKFIQKIFSKCVLFNPKERSSIDNLFDCFIESSYYQFQKGQITFFFIFIGKQ